MFQNRHQIQALGKQCLDTTNPHEPVPHKLGLLIETLPTSAFISAPVESYACSRETEEAKACHFWGSFSQRAQRNPRWSTVEWSGGSSPCQTFGSSTPVLRLLLLLQCQRHFEGAVLRVRKKPKRCKFPSSTNFFPKSSVGQIWPCCTFRLEYDSYQVHHGVGVGSVVKWFLFLIFFVSWWPLNAFKEHSIRLWGLTFTAIVHHNFPLHSFWTYPKNTGLVSLQYEFHTQISICPPNYKAIYLIEIFGVE